MFEGQIVIEPGGTILRVRRHPMSGGLQRVELRGEEALQALAEIVREQADTIALLEKLRAERDDLRKMLVGLGAGIPAAAVLKAEDRTDVAGIDPRASCQANRRDAAQQCRRCGRKIGEGCGENGPYADPTIARALEDER